LPVVWGGQKTRVSRSLFLQWMQFVGGCCFKQRKTSSCESRKQEEVQMHRWSYGLGKSDIAEKFYRPNQIRGLPPSEPLKTGAAYYLSSIVINNAGCAPSGKRADRAKRIHEQMQEARVEHLRTKLQVSVGINWGLPMMKMSTILTRHQSLWMDP
jgi:hypothetical protein